MTFSKTEKLERFRETVILLRELNEQVNISQEINKNLTCQIDSIFYLLNEMYKDILEGDDENVRLMETGRDSKE